MGNYDNEFMSKLDSLFKGVNQEMIKKKKPSPIPQSAMDQRQIHEDIVQRIKYISNCIIKTASGSIEGIFDAIRLFRDWMVNSTIIRVIGAGRARLAGSIPANRLAHGGARVFIQDDIIPMPHSIKGGGIIAVSASGKTKTVLDVLKSVQGTGIKIVGIAKRDHEPINKDYRPFRDYCHIFIGIVEDVELENPLQALADTGEYVISELLDAMVVAAGKLAGFDDTTWRMGHEDIGATGPYKLKV